MYLYWGLSPPLVMNMRRVFSSGVMGLKTNSIAVQLLAYRREVLENTGKRKRNVSFGIRD